MMGAVVRDQVLDGRAVRRRGARDAVDLREVVDRVLDRVLDAGLVDGLAVGGDDDDLRARAADLRERAAQRVERLLGFRARDAEGVVGALVEGDGAAGEQHQHEQPERDDQLAGAEGPAADRIQE